MIAEASAAGAGEALAPVAPPVAALTEPRVAI
jgi:hypothetical protein